MQQEFSSKTTPGIMIQRLGEDAARVLIKNHAWNYDPVAHTHCTLVAWHEQSLVL
jgi:hypothetical protein